MKRLVLVLVCLLLTIGVTSSVFAGSGRYANEDGDQVGHVTTVSATSDSAVVARPCYVYAASLYAGASASNIRLYDNASTGTGTVRIEVAEATQYDSVRYEFSKPIKMDNGVFVGITGTNSVATIEYR